MIKAEQVPKEAKDALEALFHAELLDGMGPSTEQIIAAAINGWPGMALPYAGTKFAEIIILPLQENSNERPHRTLSEMRGVFAEAYKENSNERE